MSCKYCERSCEHCGNGYNKNSPEQITIHHRTPKSKTRDKQGNHPVKIKRKFHEAWHMLFADKDMDKIAELINTVYGDPRYEMLVVKKCSKDIQNHRRDCNECKCECTEGQSAE